jgi:DNA topoisomerase-2
MPKKSDNIKMDAEKYDKKTQREHILIRPDTYIGDIEPTNEVMYIFNIELNKIVKENITYTPGFIKIFDEALINARDASVNDSTCDTIKVEYNIEEGYISVFNNGDVGIPVEEHPIHKQLVPSMIFGELLTSSNYNDKEERTTGGRNGIGSKAINIFSTNFIVEICDAKRGKHFIQEWMNNMLESSEPTVSKLPSKTKSSVKITFYPDFNRFGIKDLNNDHLKLFHKRTIDIAGSSHNKLKVYFNDTKININNFKSYIELYSDDTLYYDENARWNIGVIYNNSGNSDIISFVNGINTFRGGTHCSHVIDNITKTLINDYMKKKDKDLKITHTLLKDNLIFFINSIIINPAFSSQTKDTLTTKVDKFGSKYEASDIFLKKLSKCGILEHAIELAKLKESSSLKKTDGKKQIKLTGIPKLEDANKAGTKESYKCTLILTEGDSAKATAMAGLSVIGRDYFGVFPLKGKMLNVREATNIQLLNNEEIKNLKLIIGLKQGEDYTLDEKFNTLRYGHVLMLTDSDVDGSHIKGLFMNMVHSLWPSLIKKSEFIQSLYTPIIKATKGKETISFYNLVDYENWSKTKESHNYKIKYYKGLGTSTSLEAKEYFTDISQKLITYLWENQNKEIKADEEDIFIQKPKIKLSLEDDSEDENEDEVESCESNTFIPIHEDDDAIRLAFDKKRANDRKKWLKNYDKNKILEYSQKQIPYYDFIHSDLIHFSNEDLVRSIPSVIDGLKPSQ